MVFLLGVGCMRLLVCMWPPVVHLDVHGGIGWDDDMVSHILIILSRPVLRTIPPVTRIRGYNVMNIVYAFNIF